MRKGFLLRILRRLPAPKAPSERRATALRRPSRSGSDWPTDTSDGGRPCPAASAGDESQTQAQEATGEPLHHRRLPASEPPGGGSGQPRPQRGRPAPALEPQPGRDTLPPCRALPRMPPGRVRSRLPPVTRRGRPGSVGPIWQLLDFLSSCIFRLPNELGGRGGALLVFRVPIGGRRTPC
jgi:hypothetical protein